MIKVIYDATDARFGRIASRVAKDLLKGKEVAVINCEKAVISGSRLDILGTITHWKNLGGIGQKGPKVPRPANLLFKRMLRGMLPIKERAKAKEAHERLKCYIGTGDLTEIKNVIVMQEPKPTKYMTFEEVSRLI